MSEDILTRRRRLLQGAAGGAALLAGCLGSNDETDDDPGDGNDDNGDDTAGDNGDDDPGDGNDDNGDDDNGDDPGEGERQVGVVVDPDEETQQALTQLQLQAQQGELTEEEFEAELETLLEPSLADLSDVIAADTGGRVVETLPTFGAVRVNGPPDSLIDVLELETVDVLLAAGDLGPAEPGS